MNLLASAAGNGEVYIWDLTNPTKPYSPGPRSQKIDDVTCVSWNKQVAHILATASNSGFAVVWDLKNRREVMSLGGGSSAQGMGQSGVGGMTPGAVSRRGLTAIAWHPDNATQVITASEDDMNPVIYVWDLRNAHAPEKVFSGHTKGVLSVSWCSRDSDLLLSCGKDCRTNVGTLRRPRSLENCRQAPTGSLMRSGTRIILISWLQLRLTAR